MNNVKALENTIRDRLPGKSWGSFPTADLQKICPGDSADLHTAFDLYFADIAGFTVNVRNISEEPKAKLLELKQRLSKSFFERYRDIGAYRERISADATPSLHHQLTTVELNRADLVRLIDCLLEEQRGA